MKKINIFLSIFFLVLIMTYCIKKAKDSSPPNASYPYQISMTDAPGPYDAVFIDLRGIEITGNNGKTVLMNVHTGIYNLLNFSNGIDTLIATCILETNTVQQIRLILGPNNSVVINNVSYPLSTPSAEQSGLKLQVHQTLQAGVLYSVLLDFDANKSIVDMGNGNYALKPVIRTIETAISGAVKGTITPIGTLAFVMANSNISYSSNVNAAGEFLLMGLPPGTYSVVVSPALPLAPVTISNVNVTVGVTTNLGTINL
jgi:hypothetical protein